VRVIVKMLPTEIKASKVLAELLAEEKKSSQNTDNYQRGVDAGALLPDVEAATRSNLAECAVAYLLKESWNMPLYSNRLHYIRKNIPDVGSDIDVKSLRTDFRLPVIEKDRGRRIYGCHVSEDYETVEILGWIHSVDAMKPEFYVEERKFKGYRVPLDKLNPSPPLPDYLRVLVD
jgi:hypothetical protein